MFWAIIVKYKQKCYSTQKLFTQGTIQGLTLVPLIICGTHYSLRQQANNKSQNGICVSYISCISHLCYLIHDYIHSQLLNLRVLLCMFFGWGGVSNGSFFVSLVNMTFCLSFSWVMVTKRCDFNAICFSACGSFSTLHFAFSGN